MKQFFDHYLRGIVLLIILLLISIYNPSRGQLVFELNRVNGYLILSFFIFYPLAMQLVAHQAAMTTPQQQGTKHADQEAMKLGSNFGTSQTFGVGRIGDAASITQANDGFWSSQGTRLLMILFGVLVCGYYWLKQAFQK